MLPACRIDAVIAREVRSHHRSIESDETGLIPQPAMKRCMVAIPNKDLRIGSNQHSIEVRKQFRRSPAATSADNTVDRRIRECRMQVLQTILECTSIIKRPAVEGMGSKNSLVPQRLQLRDAAMHEIRLRRARRRDNRKHRPGTQR